MQLALCGTSPASGGWVPASWPCARCVGQCWTSPTACPPYLPVHRARHCLGLLPAVSRLSRHRTRLPHPPPPTPPCAHPAVRQQQPAALHIHPQDLRAAQLPHDPQQHHLHEQQVSARCSARLSRAWALPQPCGKCLQAAVSQELRRFVPAQAPPCAPCSQVHHNLLCHHHQRLEGVQMPTSEGGLLL